MDGMPMYSLSRKQAPVATASGIAEFYAGCGCAELLYLYRAVLEWFGYEAECLLYFDSDATRGISLRQGSARVKHLDTRSHWLQALVRDKIIKPLREPGDSNVADLGTKSLASPRLCQLRAGCGVWFPPTSILHRSRDEKKDGKINRVSTASSYFPMCSALGQQQVLVAMGTLLMQMGSARGD